MNYRDIIIDGRSVKKAVIPTAIIFLLIFVSFSSVFMSEVGADDEINIVSIVPRKTEVGFGETFLVDIICAPVDYIKSWEASIAFNPTLLHINSCEEGDFFEGYNTFFADGSINNTGGTLSLFYCLILGEGNVSANGTLCTLSFTSLNKVGESPIAFTAGGLTNETMYLSVNVNEGSVRIGEETIEDPWEIDGDTVFVNDSNAYIAATPHTLSQSDWVEFEFETKNFDGAVDFIWGFDVPNCYPTDCELWANYSHNYIGHHYVDRVGSVNFFNVTDMTALNIADYDLYDVTYGNDNNTYLYSFFYENHTVDLTYAAFSSFVEFGNGDDYRLTGHYDNRESYYYSETFFDWTPFVADFQELTFDYGGMNTWYLLKDVDIIHDHRYKIRGKIEVPFGTDGKYWWAMKPTDQTLGESIIGGSFYCLDPWWNATWNYVKEITVTNNLDNYQTMINVTKTSGGDVNCSGVCNNDFSDIRFVTDNGTLLPYWIEEYTSGEYAHIWVKNEYNDTSFHLYYNNSGATTTSNGNDTFPYFDNFTNSDYVDSFEYYMRSTNSENIRYKQLADLEGENIYGLRLRSKENVSTWTVHKYGCGIMFVLFNYTRADFAGASSSFPSGDGIHNNWAADTDVGVSADNMGPTTGIFYDHRGPNFVSDTNYPTSIYGDGWLDVGDMLNEDLIEEWKYLINDGSVETLNISIYHNNTLSQWNDVSLEMNAANRHIDSMSCRLSWGDSDPALNNQVFEVVGGKLHIRQKRPNTAATIEMYYDWVFIGLYNDIEPTFNYSSAQQDINLTEFTPQITLTDPMNGSSYTAPCEFSSFSFDVNISNFTASVGYNIDTISPDQTRWPDGFGGYNDRGSHPFSINENTSVTITPDWTTPLAYGDNISFYINVTHYSYDGANNTFTNETFFFTVDNNIAPIYQNMSPMNVTGVSLIPTFYWNFTDNACDTLTYDVYFDSSNGSTLIFDNTTNVTWENATDCTDYTLYPDTTYYWKVVAWDEYGESNTTAVQNFTTESWWCNVSPAPGETEIVPEYNISDGRWYVNISFDTVEGVSDWFIMGINKCDGLEGSPTTRINDSSFYFNARLEENWIFNQTFTWSPLSYMYNYKDLIGIEKVIGYHSDSCVQNKSYYNFTLLSNLTLGLSNLEPNGTEIWPSQWEAAPYAQNQSFYGLLYSSHDIMVNVSYMTNVSGSWAPFDTTYTSGGATPWWNDSWQSRQLITINHSYFNGDVDDFILLLKYSLPNGHDENYSDLRFLNYEQTQIFPYDLEESSKNLSTHSNFDLTGALSFGAWVCLLNETVSSTENTSFWMYYGNDNCSVGEDENETWHGPEKYRVGPNNPAFIQQGGIFHLDSLSTGDYTATLVNPPGYYLFEWDINSTAEYTFPPLIPALLNQTLYPVNVNGTGLGTATEVDPITINDFQYNVGTLYSSAKVSLNGSLSDFRRANDDHFLTSFWLTLVYDDNESLRNNYNGWTVVGTNETSGSLNNQWHLSFNETGYLGVSNREAPSNEWLYGATAISGYNISELVEQYAIISDGWMTSASFYVLWECDMYSGKHSLYLNGERILYYGNDVDRWDTSLEDFAYGACQQSNDQDDVHHTINSPENESYALFDEIRVYYYMEPGEYEARYIAEYHNQHPIFCEKTQWADSTSNEFLNISAGETQLPSSWENDWFTSYNSTYYWSVNLSCRTKYYNSSIQSFTTKSSYETFPSQYDACNERMPKENETDLDPNPNFLLRLWEFPADEATIGYTIPEYVNATEAVHYNITTNATGTWTLLYQGNISNTSGRELSCSGYLENDINFTEADYLITNPFWEAAKWYYINITSYRINKTTGLIWDGADTSNITYKFSLIPIYCGISIEVKDYSKRTYWINWTGDSVSSAYINWDYGDGTLNFDNTISTIHKFAAEGPYTVQCTVEVKATRDRASCSETVTCMSVAEEEGLTNTLVGLDWGGLFFWPIVFLIIITLVMSVWMLIQALKRKVEGVLDIDEWK